MLEYLYIIIVIIVIIIVIIVIIIGRLHRALQNPSSYFHFQSFNAVIPLSLLDQYFSFVAIPFKCVPSSWLSQIDLCGKCFVIQGRSDRSVMHWRYPTRWVRPPPPIYGSTTTAFQMFSVEGRQLFSFSVLMAAF